MKTSFKRVIAAFMSLTIILSTVGSVYLFGVATKKASAAETYYVYKECQCAYGGYDGGSYWIGTTASASTSGKKRAYCIQAQKAKPVDDGKYKAINLKGNLSTYASADNYKRMLKLLYYGFNGNPDDRWDGFGTSVDDGQMNVLIMHYALSNTYASYYNSPWDKVVSFMNYAFAKPVPPVKSGFSIQNSSKTSTLKQSDYTSNTQPVYDAGTTYATQTPLYYYNASDANLTAKVSVNNGTLYINGSSVGKSGTISDGQSFQVKGLSVGSLRISFTSAYAIENVNVFQTSDTSTQQMLYAGDFTRQHLSITLDVGSKGDGSLVKEVESDDNATVSRFTQVYGAKTDARFAVFSKSKSDNDVASLQSDYASSATSAVAKWNATNSSYWAGFVGVYSAGSTVSDLTPGTYYVVEVKAPTGYNIYKHAVSGTVKSGDTTTFTITDDAESGRLQLKKTGEGEGGGSVAGAVYGVYYNQTSYPTVTIDKTSSNYNGVSYNYVSISNGIKMAELTVNNSGNGEVTWAYPAQGTSVYEGLISGIMPRTVDGGNIKVSL